MKIPREIIFISIFGLFLTGYVLDLVAYPLNLNLQNPYQFFTQSEYLKVPFSTVSITLKAVTLFLLPFLVYSFIDKAYFLKGAFTLVFSGLIQLYAIQDFTTKSQILSQEWAIGTVLAGISLILPSVVFFLIGFFSNNQPKPNPDSDSYLKDLKPKSSEDENN